MIVPLSQGFVYGLLQGATEVLPISSSAHLVLLPWFFDWTDPGLGFNVMLHAGTLVAILWYFWRDWLALFTGVGRSIRRGELAGNPQADLFWKLAVASIPAGIAGLVFGAAAEDTFREPLLIAATLSGFGALLYLSDRRPESSTDVMGVSWPQAILIGIAQALAIVPGVSRSGVTITMARFLSIERQTSARFSFLLATPVVAGATALHAPAFLEVAVDAGQLVALLASAGFGFLAIVVLLRYVRTRSYTPFVVYRFALAAGIVVWAVR